MKILLKCRDSYGSVSFPAESRDGVLIPERSYPIANHTLILSGASDLVLHRDCDTLLRMPDGLYRMPTPMEQDEYTAALQASVSVQEASVIPELTEPEPVVIAPDNVAIIEPLPLKEIIAVNDFVAEEPPALLDKIKKMAGG